MLINKVSAPQTEANKSILKAFLETAIPIIGIYFISNLTIFRGKDFKTPGLTDAEIKAMDVHNERHHKEASLSSFGRALGVGLSIVNPGASEEIEDIEKAHLAQENKILDLDVAELPSPLNHKHTA